jgi:2-succinyl-5-enolpyruvyl-6-hydroxy-3-cyclohexene-1-carboxylate synthase
VLLDPDGAWADPQHRAEALVEADPLLLVAALVRRLRAQPPKSDSSWLSGFLEAEERAQCAIDSVLAQESALFGPRVVRELADLLPEAATLFVSNSMPVRDADGFLPVSTRRLRVLGSRGANGIDGILSAALGVSAASSGPCVLLTGDLALVHDLGALVTARRARADLCVVVLHDDGGGIFHHLPVAKRGEEVCFETLFAVPHGTDFVATARALGVGAQCVAAPGDLRDAVSRAVAAGGPHLVEVRMDRGRSAAHHRSVWSAVQEALDGGSRPHGVRRGART